MELKNLRSYNRKVFKSENNTLKYVFRTKHCHYKNLITGKFEDIDTTMYFDEEKRVFKQEKASYKSELPEYADEVIGFTNLFSNQVHSINAKPCCNHVKGELFNHQEDGNYVLYRNAFCEGIDLKIYAYYQGLKEVVVINKGFLIDGDLTFDFELILDSSLSFEKEDFTFKNKTIKLKDSYFRIASVWDSNNLFEPVDIEIFKKNGKTYLRKTVTKSFMDKAVFPVYTDHATSFYSGAGDGFVDARKFIDFVSAWGQSNWDYIHDQDHSVEDFEGSVAKYTGNFIEIGPYVAAGEIRLQRGFIPIDTSGIDDGATIESASLFLWCVQKFDNQNDAYGYIAVVNTTSASDTTLTKTDFDNCGDSINNPTKGSSNIDITNIDDTDSTYTEIPLNATGIGWINKTGYTKLGLRQGLDIEDRVPDNGNNGQRAIFSSSEVTGTSEDPYLEVTIASSEINMNKNNYLKKGIVIT